MTVPPASVPSTTAPGTCPSCGEPVSGHFCASCGSPLAGARCAACATILTPSAKFCHRCGNAAGAAGGPRADASSATLPWAIAGIALVCLIALLAGQRFRSTPPVSAAQAQGAPPGGDAEGGPAADADAPGVRAPDISSMSPRERADRLFDRIMRLDTEGKKDSVQFFAPMAISAYQMIPNPDADARFDMGRIAEVAGALPAAKSEADSILAKQPTHLLGLVLAMQVARASGDAAGAAAYRVRLHSAQKSELAKKLPEYDRHSADIRDALASK
ncbi:MAG TPA: zinc ribbon domain-containing protein [Gemmatimonadaceae bacterium]